MRGRLEAGECLFHPEDARVKSDEDVGPSTLERLVYSGSSRKSAIKTKVPGKTHDWVGQRKVTSYVITDRQWNKLRHLVPLRADLDASRKRVQLAQHRNAINGMLYVLYRGITWDELPVRYHYFTLLKTRQRGHSVYQVWYRWKQCGLWARMLRAAGVVDEADQVQWYRLQRVTVQA